MFIQQLGSLTVLHSKNRGWRNMDQFRFRSSSTHQPDHMYEWKTRDGLANKTLPLSSGFSLLSMDRNLRIVLVFVRKLT